MSMIISQGRKFPCKGRTLTHFFRPQWSLFRRNDRERHPGETKDIGFKAIIDDIMFFDILLAAFINCLEVVIEILMHYMYALKPKKTQFLRITC